MKPFTKPTASAILLIISSNTSSVIASNPRPPPAEYQPCVEAPSLRCANGSVCKKGEADFGDNHDHLNLQTNEDGYYCDCPAGYIGHECTIKVVDCENSLGFSPSDHPIMHSCYNGAMCENSGSGKTCNCNKLNESSAPDATKYAGLMCEHESTSMCAVSLIGFSASNHQFCTNHGQCKKEVAESAAHPKCDCRQGWSGDHCEIRSDVFAQMQSQKQGGGVTAMSAGGKVLFSFLIIALIVVVIGIAILVYSRIRQNRGPREKAVGKTAAEVGVGDIEMDGSSTGMSPSSRNNRTDEFRVDNDDNVVTDQNEYDLELKEEDDKFEDANDNNNQEFTITDSNDDLDRVSDLEMTEVAGGDTEPSEKEII